MHKLRKLTLSVADLFLHFRKAIMIAASIYASSEARWWQNKASRHQGIKAINVFFWPIVAY
jgi:hypothetical protein